MEDRFGLRWSEMEMGPMAKHAKTPALFVHDEGDREASFANIERIAGLWPKAQLMRTKGLGHYRILRNEAVRLAVVRYVARSG